MRSPRVACVLVWASPCTGTDSGMGTLLGPGTFTATLTVGAGPFGPTSCSDTFTVAP